MTWRCCDRATPIAASARHSVAESDPSRARPCPRPTNAISATVRDNLLYHSDNSPGDGQLDHADRGPYRLKGQRVSDYTPTPTSPPIAARIMTHPAGS